MTPPWNNRPREFRTDRPVVPGEVDAPPAESPSDVGDDVRSALQALRAEPANEKSIESAGFYQIAWQRFRADPTSMAALVVFTIVCLLAIAAPLIVNLLGTDPNRQDLLVRFHPPSGRFLLGTDDFGRDQLSRLLYGAQVSLGIGFIVAFVSITLGIVVGLWAGYFGGWVDDLINAVIQVQRAVSLLYILIMIAATFGPPSVVALSVLLGLWGWAGIARLVRGQTLSVKRRDYVDAARAIGAPDGRLIFTHVFPNITSIVLVIAGFEIAGAILAEAGISFLGFGIQPPTASWGNMLTNSLDYVRRAWWLVAAPGVAISITVLCILLIADGLRDAFDPRLR